MMSLTVKPSELWVRIDACHFGNNLVSLLAHMVFLLNILINICRPCDRCFFSRSDNLQAYQTFTLLSSPSRQEFLSSEHIFYS